MREKNAETLLLAGLSVRVIAEVITSALELKKIDLHKSPITQITMQLTRGCRVLYASPASSLSWLGYVLLGDEPDGLVPGFLTAWQDPHHLLCVTAL